MKLASLFFVILALSIGMISSSAHAGDFQMGDCVWAVNDSFLLPAWKKYKIVGSYAGISGQPGFILQRTGIAAYFTDPINRFACELGSMKVGENKTSDKAAKEIQLASLEDKASGEKVISEKPSRGKEASGTIEQGAE